MLNSEDVEITRLRNNMLTPCLTGHVPDAVLDAVPDA